MDTITPSQARARLYGLLDEAAESHRPIRITGRRNSAVLVTEDDWRAIQETLYLLSIPRMRKSILEGMKTPVSRCAKKVSW
jgi:prevent-host-death family protein